MFRPIRLDHTNCLQVAIKTHLPSCFPHSTCHSVQPQGRDTTYRMEYKEYNLRNIRKSVLYTLPHQVSMCVGGAM